MPFINDRLVANQEEIDKRKYQTSLSRQSRFRFDPSSVMAQLRDNIVGQDTNLSALEDMLYWVKADFGIEQKPLSVTLLLGPTGVGKTETVNIIASAILGSNANYCRVDMNTLAQEHYAAALTGAPPGYVGSKEGLSLFDSEKIKGDFSHPGIVLLDEIEKASNEVIRTLLNVLDSGYLVLPGATKVIDFSNAMIFMTSNLGAKELNHQFEKHHFSWKQRWFNLAPPSSEAIVKKALKNKFDPEFLNRIDRILTYDFLKVDSIEQVIDVELNKLNQRLKKKKAQLKLDDSARLRLCQFYDQEYGARQIAKQFRTEIEPLLAKVLIKNLIDEMFLVSYKNNNYLVTVI